MIYQTFPILLVPHFVMKFKKNTSKV